MASSALVGGMPEVEAEHRRAALKRRGQLLGEWIIRHLGKGGRRQTKLRVEGSQALECRAGGGPGVR